MIRVLVVASILLGFYRVCCLEALNSFESWLKYRKLPIEDFRLALNNEDAPLINEIRQRVKPGEGVLVLHLETYFINYNVYPVRLYKFRKGYYETSKPYGLKDVDRGWLEERNIRWVLLCGDDRRLYLRKLSEAAL